MNNWCICWFFTHVLLRILIYKGLTARRFYKSFGVKGLICEIIQALENQSEMKHSCVPRHVLTSLRHSVLIVYSGCNCASVLRPYYLVLIYDTRQDYLLLVTSVNISDLLTDIVEGTLLFYVLLTVDLEIRV
jgi:hypothetical protein